jgi:hypothetical protein
MAASMHLTPEDFSHPGYTLVKSRPNTWEGSSPLNRYKITTYYLIDGKLFEPLLEESWYSYL